MKIRKKFRVESAHIVRNCFTDRCSKSIHGHSAIVEVVLESDKVDRAGMVMDFALTKGPIKTIVDSMDHSTLVWNQDDKEYLEAVEKFSKRVIYLPFNPSAELLSLWLAKRIQDILSRCNFANDMGEVKVHSVRYHETESGWAEADYNDLQNEKLMDIIKGPSYFSPGITDEWSEEEVNILIKNFRATYSDPDLQVKPKQNMNVSDVKTVVKEQEVTNE